jgi:hypothetical protein
MLLGSLSCFVRFFFCAVRRLFGLIEVRRRVFNVPMHILTIWATRTFKKHVRSTLYRKC